MQSKSKRKKKGFTLVELLVVIMIIGIVLGISIPAVVNLQKSQNARKFDYFLTIVKEATDLYVEQYGKSFDETENCFDIVYDSLVEEDLIQESDITCLSSEGQQGIIQATRIPGTNNFTYEYFLTCTDRSTGELLYESGTPSAGCKGVNGNFIVNIDSAVKVVDGVTSDYTFDTWTRGKVIVTVSSVNPYFYDIDHYEYSLDGSSYNRMSGNQITFESSINKKVYFRAVDTNGNYSGDTVAVIKIDNDKPTASINLSGTKGDNDWYISNVTASCHNQSDGSGSGVASCAVNPGSYTTSAFNVTFTLTITDYVGNTNTVSQTIKIDKDKPVMDRVNLTQDNGNSYSSGSTSDVPVTITAVGHDNVGIAKYIYSHDLNSWSNLTNPWLINWDGSWHFYIKAVDTAGNISDNYIEFDLIIDQIQIGRTWEYGYTGNVQSFTAPWTGTYQLEAWGAQGGSYSSKSCYGGQGGYSTGQIRLNKNDTIYVVVGGVGSGNSTHTRQTGGYNGGGNATPSNDGNEISSSGGGATHIATTNRGVLANYNSYRSELLLVAAGGGGAGGNASIMCVQGGVGGGTTGGNGGHYLENLRGVYISATGYGASQTQGGSYATDNNGSTGGTATGSFGQGASARYAGGGGGLYGGGESHCSAGGGSGYLGAVSSGSMQSGVRSGSGYAKITVISR